MVTHQEEEEKKKQQWKIVITHMLQQKQLCWAFKNTFIVSESKSFTCQKLHLFLYKNMKDL